MLTVFYSVVPFLIFLSLLVFVHELGHYWVAKRNGVKVEVFSIGFGPEVFGWTDKSGTRWKLSLIPLGGYVRMFSDLNAASAPDHQAIAAMGETERKQALHAQPVGVRLAVSAAGPAANYLFAILLLAGIYSVHGQRVASEEARIGLVQKGSAAAEAGLKEDDRILKINGEETPTFKAMQEIVRARPGEALTLTYARDGQQQTVSITPMSRTAGGQTIGVLGVGQGYEVVQRNPVAGVYHASVDALRFSWMTLQSIGQMITGQRSADDLSGPIGIAAMSGEVAKKSLHDILWFIALLSINLGLINLLPVPMLDGGHILFYLIEAVRGRPVSERAQEMAFRVGFAFLIFVFLFSTWKDLANLKAIEFLVGLFK
ncbi:MAG: RIP metalloprotease RseP [Holosporales bacterium]